MDELNFKISTELKNILGKDLIINDYIAILELVKNSYDAHADKVVITFEDDAITIADNGKGMTLDDLENKWLFIGYSAKKDNTEDDDMDDSYRSKIRRHYAGAKGIGRMSCDRLGQELHIITKSKRSQTVENLYINWNEFENRQESLFESVKLKHESSEEDYGFPDEKKTGTVLILNGLNESWNRAKKIALRKSLEKLINPFSGTDNFRIEIVSESDIDIDNDSDDKNQMVNGIIENTIAHILTLKTTLIESKLKADKIVTRIIDRGILMYEIEEINKFSELIDAQVNLYYLNRAAKYNFSLKMGVQPVQYGSVFLFRNGFRILPYGNEYDDSWQLDHRAQQGYNRFLGTRDLFGRVDVETGNIENFKEVSSRDSGLIQSESTAQLFDYFTVTHRRLERYVTGVLWGEGFLRRDYFKDKETAERERAELQETERDSSSAEHVYESIGSKIDFVQLIKSLVSEKNVNVTYYNQNLADIISFTENIEDIKPKFIDDLKGIANKTDNKELLQTIEDAQEHIYTLQKEKEDTEVKLAEETERREIAEKKAKEEESKRQIIEKEKEAQVQKNRYLSSVRDTSQEITDAIHTVLISSGEMKSLVNICSYLLKEDHVDINKLSANIDSIKFHIERINKIASMITKADAAMLDEAQNVDLKEYIKEYLSNYGYSKNIQYKDECSDVIMKKIPLLDLSVIMDNLVSNSGKARAANILVTFREEGRDLIVDFSDNGDGVDLDKFTPDTIFEEGVTNRRGGSGIGLSTIKEQMNKNLNGDILFAGNGLYSYKGATFRLIFK